MGYRTQVMLALVSTALFSCLPENAGIVTKNVTRSTANQQNCTTPTLTAVANVGRRLASSGLAVGPELCSKPEGYLCHRRHFSPSVGDGQTSEQECSSVSELGGEFCLKISIRSYNTKDAALAPDAPRGSGLPGGEYNRSEYVCHQSDLKDGDEFLALAEGASLKEAMAGAFGKCVAMAPSLAAVK